MTHRLPINNFTCIYRYLVVFIGEKKWNYQSKKQQFVNGEILLLNTRETNSKKNKKKHNIKY